LWQSEAIAFTTNEQSQLEHSGNPAESGATSNQQLECPIIMQSLII